MFRYVSAVVWLLVLAFSPQAFANAQCRPLIQFAFNEVTLSHGERQRLTELIYERLTPTTQHATEYDTILTLCRPYSQITLSDAPSRYPDKFQSAYELSPIPAFAQFSLPNQAPDTTLIAQRERPYALDLNTPTYPVDDDQTAITLLRSGKVSGVIDYAVNVPIYESAFDDIQLSRLHAQTPVYLLFDQSAFRDSFDRASSAYFSAQQSDERPEMAAQKVTPVRWLVLNKYFSQQKDALVALDTEVNAVNWLDEQLPDYHFYIEQTNATKAMTALKKHDDVCAMGIYQTKERSGYALFSSPTSYYFSPRLYLRSGLIPQANLDAFINDDGVLDAAALLSERHELAIGYSPEMLKILSPVSDILVSQPRRFLQIDALERERMLALFKKGRLDGFINFPSHLIQARRQFEAFPNVESFTIVSQPIIGNAKSACNKGETGSAVIAAVEVILSDPQLRFQYMSLLTEGMLDTEKRIFHQAAGTIEQLDSAADINQTTIRQ